MSLVVSDTSPLNYLVLIGHVDVLPKLYGAIVAPPAVISELQHPQTPHEVSAWASRLPCWLEIRSPKTELHLGIGAGEDSAISLAVDLGNVPILVDDRRARAAAKSLGLPVIGTLAVLDLADESGLLDFEDVLRCLRTTSFRVEPVVAEVLIERSRSRKSS